jgi:hypothetical protein
MFAAINGLYGRGTHPLGYRQIGLSNTEIDHLDTLFCQLIGFFRHCQCRGWGDFLGEITEYQAHENFFYIKMKQQNIKNKSK